MADPTLVAREASNAVAVDSNWRHRVKSEVDAGKLWQSRWGYLGDVHVMDSVDRFRSEHALDTSTTSLGLKLTRRRQAASMDSVDAFVHQYLLKTASGPSLRCYPKAEFQVPHLTSHQVGWGKSLEALSEYFFKASHADCIRVDDYSGSLCLTLP